VSLVGTTYLKWYYQHFDSVQESANQITRLRPVRRQMADWLNGRGDWRGIAKDPC
jgi:hypothetical protein